jgi:hypothetical protein
MNSPSQKEIAQLPRTARGIIAVLAVWGAGCQDYNLQGKEDANSGRGGEDSGAGGVDDGVDAPTACRPENFPAEEFGVDDTCTAAPPGGFTPIVEWEYGSGQGCLSQPVVADLDGDGMPEVIFNLLSNFFNPPGYLTVLRGDTGALVWQSTTARLGFGSPPAVGDLDGDGSPEIVAVREYASSLLAVGDYTVVAWSAEGREVWESEHFAGLDFDYATAVNIRDMDHDGSPEVIAGRVILNGADGSTRGVGAQGRGSYGITSVFGLVVAESSVPAVTDIDLDGVDEVIVGNAMYGPNGEPLWTDLSQEDGMISVANLDDDPEGEWVAISYNTIRAVDTDGRIMWGPTEVAGANILATAGIADLDNDGSPEIVTAGGNQLVVFRSDGSTLWTAGVTDESGATGASFFDFEGDGTLEVVYIDELEMAVYDGPTGALKFFSDDHGSNTMFDYPTVADVDADGQAEILVCHNSFGAAISAYGDLDESWRPARKVWNQHAYDITNINDDLSIPTDPEPGFVAHNTWHSAMADSLSGIGKDLAGEVLEVCSDECDQGRVYVTFRLLNVSPEDIGEAVNLAVYAEVDGRNELLATTTVEDGLVSGWTTDGLVVEVDGALVSAASSIFVVADDDGTGTGALDECSETNNLSRWDGPFCE